MGIAICHDGKNEVFFAGAGTIVRSGGDDISWVDTRQVYAQARAKAEPIGGGFTDSKERIGRRTHLLGRKKVQVATARRLILRPSARARSLQRLGASIGLRLFGRTHVGVGFDFAPLLFHDAAQLALHRFERVVNYLF